LCHEHGIDETFAEVWECTIQPSQGDLPPDAARYFLKLQFADADRARMDELAAKARLSLGLRPDNA
jgi:hypothetical protein